MSEIYNNWERLVRAVLRKEELWELFHAPSRSPSVSSISSSDHSSTTFSFRLEIENLQLSDFSSSFRSCIDNGELQSSDFSPSFRSCVEIEELQSSDISPSPGSCVEIEELQSPNISPSIGSCVEIEELTPDECVRSSDSREDQMTREIITVPPREDRITRFSKFQENKMAFPCSPIFRGIFQRRHATISRDDAMILRDAVISMCRQVIVLKLAVADDKSKSKALKIAIGALGVHSAAVKDGALIVRGDYVDPVHLTRRLRKKLRHTKLVSVMPAEGARAQEKSLGEKKIA